MNEGDAVIIGVKGENGTTIIYHGRIIWPDKERVWVEIEPNSFPFVTSGFRCHINRTDMIKQNGIKDCFEWCWTVDVNENTKCPICNDNGMFSFGYLCICPDSLRKAKDR
jgi:hypothetical protein